MRTCLDCPNELVEHKGAGRPRERCAACAEKRASASRRKRSRDRRVEAKSTIRPSNESTPVFEISALPAEMRDLPVERFTNPPMRRIEATTFEEAPPMIPFNTTLENEE